MNDKELADAVITVGVGKKDSGPLYSDAWDISDKTGGFQTTDATQYVHSWMVAGALLEKTDWKLHREMADDGIMSDPYTIIRECVSSLQEKANEQA